MGRKVGLLVFVLVLMGAVLLQPAAAQGVTWTAQYYNNSFLIDVPQLVRQDPAIAFDWGTGSPAQGVNADGFTVRWASDPYFPAGTYRFWALADDEVRVNVGYAFQPQIDTFGNPKVGQIVSADVTLTEGTHHVQVDYREANGNAYVFVTWANLASNPTGPNFPQPQGTTNVNTGPWTAQYFANATLSGNPTLIQSEVSPNHNWGTGSPLASIPADNFSARWTSVQTLEAGNYQISVRVDDGVRVFVDGVAVINQWGTANAATYTANLTLGAGPHNIMVEYFEAQGNALIEFNLQRQGIVPQQPVVNPPVNAVTTGVVTAGRLNVRSAPSASASILVKVNQRESYPVLAANSDRSWYQINVNGTVGWVFGRYFNVTNPQSVPTTNVTAPTPSPSNTGYTVTTAVTLNVRSAPSTSGAILTKMTPGSSAQVVGRNASSNWWQVTYQGVTGWVSAGFARLQSGADVSRIPVTG
ncbi:MAG: SH3 domain-containing protein [Chloroflexi bacterium]|nr:SH3 domain-containing protein [Chloroflexota bacterium]